MRRTKIVCTLGSASNTLDIVMPLINAGLNITRLNFSHESHKKHSPLIELIRNGTEKSGKPVAILQDLQGSKID